MSSDFPYNSEIIPEGRTGSVIDSRALWFYLFYFGGLLASGLGLPVPEELWIVGAGATASHYSQPQDPGDPVLYWWIMLPICIIGVVVGDAFLYTIGRIWGHRLLDKKWVQRWLVPPDRRQRIQDNFKRYGVWILLGARLVPGFRSPIFLMAGMNHMPLRKFLFADLLYAIPGVTTFFFLAYVFTDKFVELVKKADSYRQVIIVAVVAFVAGYLVSYFQKHPVSEGDPKEVPIIGTQLASHLKEPENSQNNGEKTLTQPTAEKINERKK
jgi:membrane protein DedA with SNARE-associated domain